MNDKKKLISLTNTRTFKYRGKKYMVSEIDIAAPTFTGCCTKMYGIRCCIINSNLNDIEKQLTLHRLINGKKTRCIRRDS